MDILRKFIALPPLERWLLLQIFMMLPVTRLGLRLFGFKRTFAALAWLAGFWEREPPADEANEVERARRWIRYAKRQGPYHGTCLSRSLVLWWLLRRQGIESVMRIGTRRLDGEFQAHAWLEYQGRPLNAGQRVRQKYVVFEYTFTPQGEWI
jgi:hypothetical protein